ncbi:hypothetical protein PEBR_40339 [Penicillium brasilianum]|uniref:Uncharacterized protein n=1 Tax=Penicillium brasilianum TaxID=104259 RepID=A0A1S9RAP3_PENBI|nr:hypothetical protein PEBR_40339 [Penicillium brasilianum]
MDKAILKMSSISLRSAPKLSSDQRVAVKHTSPHPCCINPSDFAALKPTRPEATKIDPIFSTAPTQFPARPVVVHRIATALLEDLPDPPEWAYSPELHTRNRVYRGAIPLSSVKDPMYCPVCVW